jgi:DMSO/TMAO reductase YedYZ heme-binding membrane subunit
MEHLIIPLLSLATFLLLLGLSVYYQNHELEDGNIFQRISNRLVPASRFLVYLSWLIWLLILNFYFALTLDNQDQFLRASVQYYGLAGLALLFLTLTPGLLHVYFPHFPFNNLLLMARRALGLCTFGFAFLHSGFAFYYNFGGTISTYFSLSTPFQAAFIFGLTGLIILTLMALTSFDEIEHSMGFRRWKLLHRFVYLAAILIILHAFIRGFHFQERVFNLSMNFFTLTFVLLEIGATWKETHRRKKHNWVIRYFFYIGLLVAGVSALFVSSNNLR